MEAHDPFIDRLEPHRAALRVHCYRMIGRSHDVDDVVQRAMIRAWRAQETLEDAARIKPWLYRIATNVCLDELKDAARRPLPSDVGQAARDPDIDYVPPVDEPLWLEPMPGGWIDGCAADPEARLTLKESVALAFVAALQGLTAAQRATLLLRDVVGLSAEETAFALDVTVPAVNNALFRARGAIDARLQGCARSDDTVDEALLARYVRAWETADIGALIALLREDVATTMPPSPIWIAGRDANATFYRRMFERRLDCAQVRTAPTCANGQPALAFYRRGAAGGPFTLRAIHVLDVAAGGVARIDHFLTPRVFPLFPLPQTLAA